MHSWLASSLLKAYKFSRPRSRRRLWHHKTMNKDSQSSLSRHLEIKIKFQYRCHFILSLFTLHRWAFQDQGGMRRDNFLRPQECEETPTALCISNTNAKMHIYNLFLAPATTLDGSGPINSTFCALSEKPTAS